MVTERQEAWLKLTMEDPIDPELPICDPHHHLWERRDAHYMLDDLLQDIRGGHNIIKTVFVECRSKWREDWSLEMQPVGETEFVQDVYARTAGGQYGPTVVCAGIVGFVDLLLGAAVSVVLEAHIAAGKGRFRGIRNMSTWREDAEPPARPGSRMAAYFSRPKGLLLDPKFREGFACLQKYGLSLDSYLYHTQLMELVDLARAFPDIPIILNHVGGPLGIGTYAGKREEVFQAWKRGIAEVATCPNVVVKLGGLGMESCGFGWHERPKPPDSAELAKVMAPYFLWCIEQFGVERCMFESNFPADKPSYSYTVMWNAFKRISKDFSPGERAALFHDTAVKVYRLATREGA